MTEEQDEQEEVNIGSEDFNFDPFDRENPEKNSDEEDDEDDRVDTEEEKKNFAPETHDKSTKGLNEMVMEIAKERFRKKKEQQEQEQILSTIPEQDTISESESEKVPKIRKKRG